MSELTHSTKDIQSKLAKFVRSGNQTVIDDVNSKGLPHYRRLVINVILDALSTAYPLTKKALGDDEFKSLCNRFFSSHACSNPQVWKMPKELIDYFMQAEDVLKQSHPYLIDLLIFEWLELDLYTMEDSPLPTVLSTKYELDSIPAILQDCKIITTSYPVHKTPPEQLKDIQANQYFILGYRNFETGRVYFEEMSPFLAVLFERMSLMNEPLLKSIAHVAQLFQVAHDENLNNQIDRWLLHLQNSSVVLGKI